MASAAWSSNRLTVGLLLVRFAVDFVSVGVSQVCQPMPCVPTQGPQQMKGYGTCRPVLRSRSSLTDTSDTVLRGNPGNERNHRNSSQTSNLLVTRTNTGYYRGSVGFTSTC